MDKFNLKLHVEQGNYTADTIFPINWEGNEELALNNVVDPNTEFKSKITEKNISSSPIESYGLNDLLQSSIQSRVLDDTQQCFDSNPLVFQIEAAITGDIQSKFIVNLSDKFLPRVHAYISPQYTVKESTLIMNSSSQTLGASITPDGTHDESQGRLLKYPPERITVLTEKRSYLTSSHNKDQGPPHNSPAVNTMQDNLMTKALSNDSVATICAEPERLSGRESVLSTKSLSSIGCGLDRSTTTADQLAWAFRTARDRLDTASNISGCSSRFELDSNCSERAETMSTISDVSGYEEEMFRIRRLLLLDSSTSPVDKLNFKYMDQCREVNFKPKLLNNAPENTRKSDLLSSQKDNEMRINKELQNALAEKEKYRLELSEVETRVSLEWQEKYQESLRQRAHIEGRLESVQAELETLISERQTILDRAKGLENEARTKSATEGKALFQELEKLTLEYNNVLQLSRELEQQKQELCLQLELKESEVTRWKEEMQEVESLNEKLRIEVQELKIEMETKDGANQGLKRKIAEQHVEFQSLLQAKLKAENSLTSSKNEIDSIRKSGHWYRDQLHMCQTAKVKVQQELMASQANLTSHSHLVEKLRNENAHLHLLVKDTQQQAVREKESLMRKLEVIQADMVEREAAILGQIHREDVTAETITTITAQLRKVEQENGNCVNISVKELEEQIETFSKDLRSQDTYIVKLETENSQLMMRLTTLQKTLNEKELSIQSLENKYRHLEMCYHETTENLKSKEQSLLDVRNEKVITEVSLVAAMKEKEEVDSAINKLREDFARISKGYQTMKNEIRLKEKEIEKLEIKIKEQKKNEEMQNMKIVQLGKVESELNSFHDKILNIESLEQEVEHVNCKNKELHSKVSELTEVRNHIQDSVSKLEETLAFREEQLMNQARSFEVHSEELKARDQLVLELHDQKRVVEENLEMLHQKLAELESLNINLLNEIKSYKKQLSDANCVIEQFNLLCRGSEQEKYDLGKQLQKVTRELQAAHIKSEIKTNLECNPVIHQGVDWKVEPEKKVNVEQEVMSNHKTDPSEESASIQDRLQLLHNLIGENENKIMLLVSENQDKSLQKINERSHPISNDVIDFKTISLKLTEMSGILDKALKAKHNILTKLEKEIEIKEKVEGNFLKLSHELEKVSHCKDTNISNTKSGSDIKSILSESSTNTISDAVYLDSSQYREEMFVYQKEINKLKSALKVTEIEQREKHRRYESNVRTLLKKVKEHMRGRKVAEQHLAELRGKSDFFTNGVNEVEVLQLEVKKLETELEASRRQCEEQKRIAERTQETMLQLERDRGKLAQSQEVLKEQQTLNQSPGEWEVSISDKLDQQARELQLQQMQRRIAELELQAQVHGTAVRELKKQIFAEKCENSKLRKHLASLRMGLDTANDVLDTRNIELGRSEVWCQALDEKNSVLQKALEMEQRTHEECKEENGRLKVELEEAQAKDPVLADQIKTLSYHLHQKNQEAASLREKVLVAEEHWSSIESSLQQNTILLQDEVTKLRSELDSLRRDKFTLQTQATELRTALHSSLEQNKMLKLKLEAHGCDRLPDLTSSLPSPPVKYDETQIAELLHQSTVLPSNKPLSNLQSCLDSLKQEMDTLQMQLTARTSGYPMPPKDDIGKQQVEHSSVQDV